MTATRADQALAGKRHGRLLANALAELEAHGESTAREIADRLGLDDARQLLGALRDGQHAGLCQSWRHPAGGPVLWSLPGTAATNPADARLLARLRLERNMPVPRPGKVLAVDVDWICLVLTALGFQGSNTDTWINMPPDLASACGSLEALVTMHAVSE